MLKNHGGLTFTDEERRCYAKYGEILSKEEQCEREREIQREKYLQRLREASDEITQHIEDNGLCYGYYEAHDEIIRIFAKKYQINPKKLADYHNTCGYDPLRAMEEDMGLPYGTLDICMGGQD